MLWEDVTIKLQKGTYMVCFVTFVTSADSSHGYQNLEKALVQDLYGRTWQWRQSLTKKNYRSGIKNKDLIICSF